MILLIGFIVSEKINKALLRSSYRNLKTKKGFKNAEVYADSYAALNGHPSQAFIDNTIDLAKQPINFAPKKWILPFKK